MHDDAAAADWLIEAVVIDNLLTNFVFRPDFDTEGVRGVIAGPEHELVHALPIDGAQSFEPGIVAAGHHQPLVAAAVEIQVGCVELELGIADWYGCALFVL